MTIYYYYYTQLVAANWRIDLDTWIFVKTFKVSAFASPSLVLASNKHTLQRMSDIFTEKGEQQFGALSHLQARPISVLHHMIGIDQ